MSGNIVFNETIDSTLFSDLVMNFVFDHNLTVVEKMLRIILGKDDIFLREAAIQNVKTNLLGRSVIFDILAIDKQGNRYNIEMQRGNHLDLRKRSRYHASMMDFGSLEKGDRSKDPFRKLPDTYVIFITEIDYLQKGRPVYFVKPTILDSENEIFDNGITYVFVNGAYDNTATDLGKLIHDLKTGNPDNMYHTFLADAVKSKYKEIKEGNQSMWEYIQDVFPDQFRQLEQAAMAKGEARGEARGRAEGEARGEARGEA